MRSTSPSSVNEAAHSPFVGAEQDCPSTMSAPHGGALHSPTHPTAVVRSSISPPTQRHITPLNGSAVPSRKTWGGTRQYSCEKSHAVPSSGKGRGAGGHDLKRASSSVKSLHPIRRSRTRNGPYEVERMQEYRSNRHAANGNMKSADNGHWSANSSCRSRNLVGRRVVRETVTTTQPSLSQPTSRSCGLRLGIGLERAGCVGGDQWASRAALALRESSGRCRCGLNFRTGGS